MGVMTVLANAVTADSGGFLSDLADWSVGLMERLGAPGAGIAIGLENVFPPLPSEVILPLAGFTASRGSFGLVEVLIWTTLGSVVGALVWYLVGVLIGRERTRWLLSKVPLIKMSDIDRTEAWFARHGAKTVFFGRMIPIFRSLISIPAGVERMRLLPFLGYTLAGSAIWNTIFVMAGYYLGERWTEVEEYADLFQNIVIAVVVLAVAAFVVLRLRSRRRRAAAGLPVEPAEEPEAPSTS